MASNEIVVDIGSAAPWVVRIAAPSVVAGVLAALVAVARLIWEGYRRLPML